MEGEKEDSVILRQENEEGRETIQRKRKEIASHDSNEEKKRKNEQEARRRRARVFIQVGVWGVANFFSFS